MPIYDPFEQRMAVRVVYDGVACAGKTTNLRQLCMLLAAQRSSEVHSPADLHGRTLFFDWMNVMAGVVCGFPLLCQVVSVPGQVVLTPRRRHLLSTADVVVFVCESSESSIATARAGLELYDEVARERGVPIPLIIQANKQDQPGALAGSALLRALGREDATVVEGIASEGVGVVDTFVGAVRIVARAIQARSEKEGLRIEVRRAEKASEVLARLAKERIDPEWAAEMLLEEAQSAFLVQEANATMATDDVARGAAAAAAVDLSRIDLSRIDLSRIEESTSGAPATGAAPEVVSANSADSIPKVADVDGPILPSPDVPTGFIWPAHTGRATLRGLELAVASVPGCDERGVLALVTHGHAVRTSTRARFPDGEAARQALVRNARECTQLGRLLVPETVLIAQPANDGACWIWTVRPDLPTIERQLRTGAISRELLASYGVAVVEALRTSLRNALTVDLSPGSFGVQQGVLRYLGELLPETPSAENLSSSMFAAVDAIERAGAELSAFLEAFERELQRQLTAEERVRATVSMPPAPTSSELTARTAEERLYEVLARATESQ